jgi:hypothetical protein
LLRQLYPKAVFYLARNTTCPGHGIVVFPENHDFQYFEQMVAIAQGVPD